MNGDFIVGMGRIVVERDPAVLSCIGLGSCIGVSLYDKEKKIGGLAHIMLPDSEGTQPPEITTAIIACQNVSLSIDVRGLFEQMGIKKIIQVHHSKVLETYKKERPQLLFFEVLSLSEDAYILEQIKEEDINVNIILCGDIDKSLRSDLYNQDILTLNNPVIFKKLEVIVNLLKYKNFLKYADVSLNKMFGLLDSYGVNKNNLSCKLVGGAKMFEVINSPFINIGKMNIDAIKKTLANQKVHVTSEDLGGKVGRTIRFDLSNGLLHIKTKEGTKII